MRQLLRLFSEDVENVQRVLELIRYFHPPIPAGRKLTVYALEHLSGRYGGLLPRCMLVRKLLTLAVDLDALVRNVKEIPRHHR